MIDVSSNVFLWFFFIIYFVLAYDLTVIAAPADV